MIHQKFLVICFLASSFALAASLCANWFTWSMADFDCIDGYWACRNSLFSPMAIYLGIPLSIWTVLTALLIRQIRNDAHSGE